MKDIKPIIASNLSKFRKNRGLTQVELAEKLNYSDKAVSRWERGDTMPDISVLYELCNFYGITLDLLVTEDAEVAEPERVYDKNSMAYRILVMLLSVSFVWMFATVACIYSNLREPGTYFWMAFVWATPLTCLVLKLAGRGVINNVMKIILDSTFVWTLLACVYLQILKYNMWMVFLLGIPLQAVIILWIKLKKYK
ncbi:MAG: helix-turn-helix transcriptional regulator [Clostridia bacterium]|nr:helix-turn-helix transcriptional regulator [Clostridia bacterium]